VALLLWAFLFLADVASLRSACCWPLSVLRAQKNLSCYHDRRTTGIVITSQV